MLSGETANGKLLPHKGAVEIMARTTCVQAEATIRANDPAGYNQLFECTAAPRPRNRPRHLHAPPRAPSTSRPQPHPTRLCARARACRLWQ